METLIKNRSVQERIDLPCVVCDTRKSKSVYTYRCDEKSSDILQCSTCGHLFIHPVPLVKLDERTMDSIDDAEFFGNPLLKSLHEHLVIGNESSAIHIACACGVPSFCIAGGGHWGRFVPYMCDLEGGCKPIIIHRMMDCYRCQWFCRYPRAKGAPVKCIGDIDTEQAWKIIVSTLKLNV